MDADTDARLSALVPRIEAMQRTKWRSGPNGATMADVLTELLRRKQDGSPVCTLAQLERLVGDLESRPERKAGYPMYAREFCSAAGNGGVVHGDGQSRVILTHRELIVDVSRPVILAADKHISLPNGCQCEGEGIYRVYDKRAPLGFYFRVCWCPIGMEIRRNDVIRKRLSQLELGIEIEHPRLFEVA